MQPVLTLVPPRCLRSMIATRKPCCEKRAARDGPAWLDPMMIASKWSGIVSILSQFVQNHAIERIELALPCGPFDLASGLLISCVPAPANSSFAEVDILSVVLV